MSLPTPATEGGVPVVDLDLSVHAVNIVIPQFANGVQAILATIMDIGTRTLDVSATAHYSASLDAFRSVFMFSANDVIQFTDPNGNVEDLRFYVVDPSANLSDAAFASKSIVTDNAIITTNMKTGASLDPASQLQVSQDYVRYLAKSIFGTPAGVDLFYNETALVNDVDTKINVVWNDNIVTTTLTGIASDNGELLVDASAASPYNAWHYLENSAENADTSVGQTIFDQLLTLQPGRFNVGSTNGSIRDSGNPQSIPLIAGDSISFELGVAAEPTQETMAGGSIGGRVYKITLDLN